MSGSIRRHDSRAGRNLAGILAGKECWSEVVAVDPGDQSPADGGRVPWRVTSAEPGSGSPVGELFAARSPRWQEEARVPPCGSGDLAVSVRWLRAVGGGLRGEVVAENVSGRVCRLGRKPGLQPLGLDGRPLGVDQ